MTESTSNYDIVIAGGGMIGSSLALALAPLGLNVAVVEAIARDAAAQPSFDDRSTALSRSTQRSYEAMGLWPEISAASTPIRRIHVSDKGRFGFSHIDAQEQGVEALGYVVINRVLGNVLQNALENEKTIDVFCPARIVDVQTTQDRAIARLEDSSGKRDLNCRLLVAADGTNSSVRELIGISVSQSMYEQRAVIGNLLTEKPIDNVAYERFTSTGSLALLPIADGRTAFVWIVGQEEAERLLSLDDGSFRTELYAAFGHRLGAFSKIGKRVAYPLMLSQAMRLTGQRSVIVGNAAHGLHPVAAQGFNLGMRDVATLCDCIADRMGGLDAEGHSRADIGDNALLQRYADWRQADHKKLVRFTDGLVRLFRSNRRSVRLLRNIGMLGFDLIPGVRGEFARHTMGLAGRLPRLSRGVRLS